MDNSKTVVIESTNKTVGLSPADPKKDWGKGMTDPMAVVIEQLISFKAQAIISFSAQNAKKLGSPATDAMDVIKEHDFLYRQVIVIPPA